MSSESGPHSSAEQHVREIRRQTRKRHSTEDKIRIVLEGLRGEYSIANRLQNASGPWGTKTFYYDGVGNRTHHESTPAGGSLTGEVLNYGAGHNRLESISVGGATTRQFTCDGAGNMRTDNRAAGNDYIYAYSQSGQLRSVKRDNTRIATYRYNANRQLVQRTTYAPSAASIYYLHYQWGNPRLRGHRRHC